MRTIGCFFMFIWLFLSGCMLDRNALPPALDAGTSTDSVSASPPQDCGMNPDVSLSIPEPVATWPRSHPAGTLLVDHDRELWMVIEDGLRAPVSGDDTLGEIGLDEHDATPMTLEEERCLHPVDDYWGPGNYGWRPVYGPNESDPGPFMLDGALHVRRPVSTETLESWGYYWRWMDYFDGGEDEWASYTFDPSSLPIRDGTLVHTEYGFYYVVHGRSFYFFPNDLIAATGYHAENALWMRDQRLRELAPASIRFDYDTFNRCPADELSL